MNNVRYNQKTHEQFLIDFEIRQPNLFNSIEIIDRYLNAEQHILVSTKYGNCLTQPTHLIRGTKPTIQSAIDKTSYFKNQLKDKQLSLYNDIEILGDYIDSYTKILVNTKYGKCLVDTANLLSGKLPSIKTAINKTEYFIAQAKEIHGNLYDYSLVEYINSQTTVKIISPHGIFEQKPNSHLLKRGCPILAREATNNYHRNNPFNSYKDGNYVEIALKSKRFNSFKVYIIKCWNDDKSEVFYKIGKTFLTVNQRFKTKITMPYNYLIVKEIEFEKSEEGGLACCKLERRLQAENKEFKYLPKIQFDGQHECFSSIDNLIIKRELI